MKLLLALCLVLYFFAEVSAKPAPQMMEQALDLFEKAKAKAQEALDQAQETANRAIATVKSAVQTGLSPILKSAQSKLGTGEFSTPSEIDAFRNTETAAA